MSARTRLHFGSGRFLRRLTLVGCASCFLWACVPTTGDSSGLLGSLGDSPDVTADRAMAALMRGDYITAEENIVSTLKNNPQHPYGLLAGGLLYQSTNRPLKARALYEKLMSLRAPQTATIMGWTPSMQRTSLADIARSNLQALNSGAPAVAPKAMANIADRDDEVAELSPVPPVMSPFASAPVVSYPSESYAVDKVAVLDPRTQAVADRFLLLRKLRDEQLVSLDEYAKRRARNIGGLLPLSKPQPSKGLDRPVPGIDLVEDRLKALQQALLGRSLTPREHAIERELILDAILPEKPEVLAKPAPAPKGILASAARVRQLEHLRTIGLITEKEMNAEKVALERSIQSSAAPDQMGAGGATSANPQMLIPGGKGSSALVGQKANAAASTSLTDSLTVHLSSYRTRAQALTGWKNLRKKYRSQLGTLAADIVKAAVPNKGTFYRLHVGPMDSKAAANRLCASLRKKRQFCSVSE